MRILLVRHGQSIGNVVQEDMPDPQLTDLGRRQAVQVAEFLSRFFITQIFASPLIRCLATAQPLARALGIPINAWMDLVEVRDQGRFIGPGRKTLESSFPEAILELQVSDSGWVYHGTELPREAAQRARRVVQRLGKECGQQTAAVFAHGTFNNYLLAAALGIPFNRNLRFRQSNGGINVLDFLDGCVSVSCINDCSHLMPDLRELPPWTDDMLPINAEPS